MNPIRKKRVCVLRPPGGGMGLAVAGYWYALCPDCGEKIKAAQGWPARDSRKRAKDALYDHLRTQHAPGRVETVPS